MVGLGLGEGCRHDGRAFGANRCTDGHEKATEMLAFKVLWFGKLRNVHTRKWPRNPACTGLESSSCH